MSNKCKFYDDGHGNGHYLPGACCGPPKCDLIKDYSSIKCDGDINKCPINNLRIKTLNNE